MNLKTLQTHADQPPQPSVYQTEIISNNGPRAWKFNDAKLKELEGLKTRILGR